MKKGITKILALAAVLTASAAVFAGCGATAPSPESSQSVVSGTTANSDSKAAVGTWELTTILADGKEWSLEDYCKEKGEDLRSKQFSLRLHANGNGSFRLSGYFAPIEYRVEGNKVIVSTDTPQEDGTKKKISTTYTLDKEKDTLSLFDKKSNMGSIFTKVAD